jgi:uncharacterized protein (TIGR03067 family)
MLHSFKVKYMRLVLFISLLLIGLSCATTKKIVTHSTALNGTWVPLKQEIGGKELPAAVYEKQKLVISDGSYTLMAESIDKGVVAYGDNKMDIYGKEGVNAGKHFTAIYKFENGQLTVCYNLLGDSYPEAFDTKGKPTYFLSVFKKEMVK